jgi:hypothetical protein
MKPEDARRMGKAIGREWLAKRAIEIARKIADADSHQYAIMGVGRMNALFMACGYDDYLDEKTNIGQTSEEFNLIREANAKADEQSKKAVK